MPAQILTTTVRILAWLPVVYYAAAATAARRFFQRSRADRQANRAAAFTPPVSVLKPVRGLDLHALDHFTSFCVQDYPEYEILFAVADAGDPAIPVIRDLAAHYPSAFIRLFVGIEEIGASGKVNSLCRLAREARYDILVVSDSDIAVPVDYLRAVAAPFRDARVGAVTCLYRGVPEPGIWPALEALGISTDFAAGVVVAQQLEGVKFALGATMATTRARLAEIGGFEALAEYCADDFEFGRRIAAHGHRVEVAACTVSTESSPSGLYGFFSRQLRWAVTMRHSRPWGYLGRVVVTQGLPWAIAGALVAPSAAMATVPLAAYLSCRLWMAWVVGARGLDDATVRRRLALVPVYDAAAVVISIAALCVNHVEWRGRRFRMRSGKLVPIAER
jgi:ceramide glucosyltransferase